MVWKTRSEEHTSELQSLRHLVCRLLLEKTIYLLIAGTLYSLRSGVAARAVGMASLRHCVGPRHPGNCVQEFRNRTFPHRVGRCVCGNGLAGRVRDASFTARSHVARHSLDCAGRPALYRGHSHLRFRPPVLLPRVMASLCAGREHLSLLRRALLCCPAAHLTRKRLQLISTALQSRGLIG